jgi:hypothetical protein
MAWISGAGYLRGVKIDRETGLAVYPLMSAIVALNACTSLIGHHWTYALVTVSLAFVPLARWDWERSKLAFERREKMSAQRPRDIEAIGAA